METKGMEVLGRQFRTRTDYEAALKDAEYITQIKKRYDLQHIDGMRELISDLRAGKYRFRTILGQDFLEEMEYCARKLMSGGSNTSKSTGSKQKNVKKNGVKKTTGKKNGKKKKLEDYDEEMQKSILQELRRREKIRKWILTLCACVALVSFGYLGLYYYQTKRLDDYAGIQQSLKGVPSTVEVTPETLVIHYEDQEIIVPDILEEYKTLYSLNKKLIGWIKIDDTYIDYPVLQTSNNEYYMNHNFDQEEDKNGSIFLDTNCSILPRSTNLIIYGHHMRSGRMFGQLNKYSSEDFYEEHKYIQFDTIYEKGTYEVMYVFRSKIYTESEIVFKYYQFYDASSETEFNSYMREMAEMSLYDTGVTAEYGDELLTLSTCDYYTDNGRFVVVAKKIQ